jgi:hypothetical protein
MRRPLAGSNAPVFHLGTIHSEAALTRLAASALLVCVGGALASKPSGFFRTETVAQSAPTSIRRLKDWGVRDGHKLLHFL